MKFGARAPQFFGNVIFMIKSCCKFFCLVITQKANFLEQFEVWNFFRKFDFFKKILDLENFEKFQIFFGFYMKKSNIKKEFIAIDLKDIWILKIRRIHRIHQKISCWKNFWRARISWRVLVEYSTIKRKNRWFWIFARAHFYGRIFYMRAPRDALAPQFFSK